MTMKRVLQIALLGWFGITSALLFVATSLLLFASDTERDQAGVVFHLPDPPALAQANQSESEDARAKSVTTYTQQVTAYNSLLSAYTQLVTAVGKCGAVAPVVPSAPSPTPSPTVGSTVSTSAPSCGQGSTASQRYELAVTKTLEPLLDRFIVALIGFAFVQVSGKVAAGYLSAKFGKVVDGISLFE